MALTARQAPFLWLSRDRPTNHSLVTLWGPQAVKMISLAASHWFKVGLPAQRWSSIPTCRSQLYGHFTSLSVHGQETCQSKTPPWQQFCVVLWRPSRAPPSTLPNLPPVIRKYDCTLVGRETVEIWGDSDFGRVFWNFSDQWISPRKNLKYFGFKVTV